MVRPFSQKVQAEIDATVKSAAEAGRLVRVYFEAERIRRANIQENLALEDVLEEIMRRAADGPGYEADAREAHSSLMGEDLH